MDGDFAKTWSAYVREQLRPHRLTNEQVGEMAGVSATMVGNWLNAQGFSQPKGQKVIQFWRQFGEGTTLPQAMAAAGYGTVEEYDTVVRTRPDLDLVELDDLLRAVRDKAEASPLQIATSIEEVTKTRKRSSRRTEQLRNARKNPPL